MSDDLQANGQGRGRPRDTDADSRVLRACVELLTELGAEATTMSAVIERSGVARATVYRRWPNREALLIAALREVKGRGPVPRGLRHVPPGRPQPPPSGRRLRGACRRRRVA